MGAVVKGYLIFNGGEAFTPRSRMSDHIWLELIRGLHRPRLVVVPVAAMEKHQRIADQTMRYFNHLGTFAQYSMIVDQRTANTALEYQVLDKVEAIVLTDGSPFEMIERLRGTHTEAALRRALERKAAVMATGASAMALGAVYWLANEWVPGLGLAPNLAILPQHDFARMRLSPERLLAGLPEGVTLIGVDQATALIGHPDGRYQIEGEGGVTVYRSVEHQDEVEAGKTFTLEPPGPETTQPDPANAP
jgi:cyanophycinase-like exopeptidase